MIWYSEAKLSEDEFEKLIDKATINEYWKKCLDFVTPFFDAKADVPITKKQYSWLKKIKESLST